MMNMVVDNRITKTPELTGQFMVFPKSFGSEDLGQSPWRECRASSSPHF